MKDALSKSPTSILFTAFGEKKDLAFPSFIPISPKSMFIGI